MNFFLAYPPAFKKADKYIRDPSEIFKKKMIESGKINSSLIGDQFVNMIRKTGSLVSGSFVLQCIYDECWTSDIDLYTNQNNYRAVVQFFEEKMYERLSVEKSGNYKTYLDRIIYRFENVDVDVLIYTGEFKTDTLSASKCQSQSDQLEIKKLKLEVSEHDKKSSKSNRILNLYPLQKFDLDICKVYFDGYKFGLFDKNQLTSRRSVLNHERYEDISIDDYPIVVKGNNYLFGDNYFIEQIIRGITNSRIRKYNGRGFKISDKKLYTSTTKILLCGRKQEGNLFHEDVLPLKVFKIIVGMLNTHQINKDEREIAEKYIESFKQKNKNF